MHQTQRLTLDKPGREDFERFYAIHSDPQTNLFNPAGPLKLETSGEAFNRLAKHWQDHHFGSWAIKLKNAKNRVIGFGGLSYRQYGEERKLNLGYRFDKAFWGQGFATEVAQYAIRYGFTDLNADKIFALVRPNHTASINVLEKCNMQFIATLDDVPNEEQSLVYCIEKTSVH